jgi:hypothetical protein
MMKEELQWKAIEDKNAAIKWGEFAGLWSSSEDCWLGVPSDAVWPSPSEGLLRADGWPDLKVRVEVSIEVHSDLGGLSRGDSACRSLMIIECFSVSNLLSLLCYCTIGTSTGSCSPLDRSSRGIDQVVSQ